MEIRRTVPLCIGGALFTLFMFLLGQKVTEKLVFGAISWLFFEMIITLWWPISLIYTWLIEKS